MSKRSQLKGDNNDSGNKKKRKVDETKEEIGDLEDLPDAFVHHKKSMHNFSEAEIGIIREKLLQLFDLAKRDLPWRKDRNKQSKMTQNEKNIYAYQVWVSEIMLQQTRVATVIEYFNKWTAKWPTVEDLAKATQEEVNAMWSGLGYYRRAKNLHKGAVHVVENFKGTVPNTVDELLQLPGVGRYTAGAISSIAFNQPVPLVDGNVIRVLSRIRAIAGNIKKKETIDLFWKLAGQLVDYTRAGCFNQALMELGATICTPLSPKCDECPVRDVCLARKFTDNEKKLGMEFKGEKVNCSICETSGPNNFPINSVTIFPVKQAKNKQREEHVAVCIVERKMENGNNLFLLSRRPNSGLLAGLWETPGVVVKIGEIEEEEEEEDEIMSDEDEEEGKKKKGKGKGKGKGGKDSKEKKVAPGMDRSEMEKEIDKYLKEELDLKGYVVEKREDIIVSGDIESKYISHDSETDSTEKKEEEEEKEDDKKTEKKKGTKKGKEKEKVKEVRQKGSVKWVEESAMDATTETSKCMKGLEIYKKTKVEITPETKISLKRGKGEEKEDEKKKGGEKKKREKKTEVPPASQKSISSFFTKK